MSGVGCGGRVNIHPFWSAKLEKFIGYSIVKPESWLPTSGNIEISAFFAFFNTSIIPALANIAQREGELLL